MIKRHLTAVLLSALSALTVSAQRITTQQDLIDCGQVLFRKPVTVTFDLKNKDSKPLVISKVLIGCGCTDVEFPRAAIPGGESFKVKVTYDAKQMGHFERLIDVYAVGVKRPLMLTLRGVVVSEVVDYSGTYPYMVGNLLTDMNEIEFDDVSRGERPTYKIHIFNNGIKPVQPVVMHLPDYLSAAVSPSTITPGHAGVMTVTLDSHRLRGFGLTQTTVFLGMFPGDKVAPNKAIDVSAVLLPSFNQMTEAAKRLAPKIQLSSTELHLNTLGDRKKARGEILLQNVGKSKLEIRSLQMFTSGLQVSLNKTRLAPGESAKLKITAVAESLKSVRTKPRVLMITNDPDAPKIIITIDVK